MGKKLAIKGHPTRGKEVIELLKMMGGKGSESYHCSNLNRFYYISHESICWDYIGPEEIDEYNIFTLEEFLEKFPFKVGDFVRIPEYESEVRICKMKWCPLSEHIEYLVYRNDDEEWYTTDELLEDNDNPNKTRDCKKCGLHFGSVRCFDKDCPHNTPKSYAVGLKDGKVIECTHSSKMKNVLDELLEHIKTTPKEELKREFEEIKEWSNVGPTVEEFMTFCECVNKKPVYPKTYDECCDILNADEFIGYEFMINFPKLFNARNAYWKIAGDELGLDGPWKPDWSGFSDGSYPTITKCNDRIVKTSLYTHDCIIAFPTTEMRDAFYENFKDLIEQCKEFL